MPPASSPMSGRRRRILFKASAVGTATIGFICLARVARLSTVPLAIPDRDDGRAAAAVESGERRRRDGTDGGVAAVATSRAGRSGGGAHDGGGTDDAARSRDHGDEGRDDRGGKDRLVRILLDAGVSVDENDGSLLSSLPAWTDVVSLYGPKPIVRGLDTCEEFRRSVPRNDSYVGPAGMFNTGTNLLADLLFKNCEIQSNKRRMRGMLWQVSWGKHLPPSYRSRLNETSLGNKNIQHAHVLPAVMIKDPYFWMGSLCRHPYEMRWKRHPSHCPNLVADAEEEQEKKHRPSKEDGGGTRGVPVKVNGKRYKSSHPSMAHYWNDWYGAYHNVTFPRLIVRYEDLLFHAEETLTSICDCAGGRMKPEPSFHLVNSTKPLQGNEGNGLIATLTKYGSPRRRYENMTEEDRAFARQVLDVDLISIHGYALDDVGTTTRR